MDSRCIRPRRNWRAMARASSGASPWQPIASWPTPSTSFSPAVRSANVSRRFGSACDGKSLLGGVVIEAFLPRCSWRAAPGYNCRKDDRWDGMLNIHCAYRPTRSVFFVSTCWIGGKGRTFTFYFSARELAIVCRFSFFYSFHGLTTPPPRPSSSRRFPTCSVALTALDCSIHLLITCVALQPRLRPSVLTSGSYYYSCISMIHLLGAPSSVKACKCKAEAVANVACINDRCVARRCAAYIHERVRSLQLFQSCMAASWDPTLYTGWIFAQLHAAEPLSAAAYVYIRQQLQMCLSSIVGAPTDDCKRSSTLEDAALAAVEGNSYSNARVRRSAGSACTCMHDHESIDRPRAHAHAKTVFTIVGVCISV